METTAVTLTLTGWLIGGCLEKIWEKVMKFIFAIAIVVASTAMTQVDYAYALDCSATNLSKQEQGICAVRAAVSANAKTAPVLTTPTTAPDKIIAKNRCAGIVGKALADCNRVKK